MLEEIKYEIRSKIDTFLEEFKNYSKIFEIFICELFEKKEKSYLFFHFVDSLDFIISDYNEDIFKGTIFEIIFFDKKNGNGKEKFITQFTEKFCNSAYFLYKKCPKLFFGVYSEFSKYAFFLKSYSTNKTIIKIKNKTCISFFEQINGNSYNIISNNLLIYTLNQSGLQHFSDFLQTNLNDEIFNFILLEETMIRNSPFMDIISSPNKSLEVFISNLIENILNVKIFKRQKIIVLTTILNYWTKLSKSHSILIQDLKQQFKL